MIEDKTKKVIRQGSTEKPRITVRFSSNEEKESVELKAKGCGYGTEKQSGASSYMKAVCLGYKPMSIFDQQVQVELCDIHADLGRVGGLIKKAMNDGLVGDHYNDHMREILQTKRELRGLIRDIRDGKFTAGNSDN